MRECGIEYYTRPPFRAWRCRELDEIASMTIEHEGQWFGAAVTEQGAHPSHVAFTMSPLSPSPQSGVCAGIKVARSLGIVGELRQKFTIIYK